MILLLACAEEQPGPEEQSDVPAFWLGVNLPWVQYGVDVHSTAWGDYTLSSDPEALGAALDTVQASGAHSIRWWLFGDGRAMDFTDGLPVPPDDEVYTNLDLLFDEAAARDLTVLPVLIDFGWCAAAQDVSGVTLGGHARVFDTQAGRDALTDVAVAVAAHVEGHPALAGWDLFNEPEWAFDGDLYGLGDTCDPEGVTAWVDSTGDALAAIGPEPTSVGSASYAWMTEWWLDAAPPLLQFHDYWEPLDELDADLGRPVIVGEHPTADADEVAALDLAWDQGFVGSAPWSVLSDDDATDFDAAALAGWAADHEVGGRLP